MSLSAADLGIPDIFNAADFLVDRTISNGRGGHIAIECADERITYAEVRDNVNRAAGAFRRVLGIRAGDRVLLLLHDGPDFVYSFFGAIRIGAVPVPLNTL